MEIEQLRQAYNEAREKARELREQLDILDDLERIPKLKDAYEGKFFKFKNSYGIGGHTPDWWLYLNIRKINDDRTAVVVQFERNAELSKFEVKENEHYYDYDHIEIGEDEYSDALKDFLSYVDTKTTPNEQV